MPIVRTVTLCVLLLQNGANADRRRSLRLARSLAESRVDYGPLISGIQDNEDWCISASNGVGIGARVGFERCNGSDEQKWMFESNKWHSKVNPSRCMSVDVMNPSDIVDGSAVRMADCVWASTFAFDVTDDRDYIVVKENPKYCIVNRGSTPDNGDPMIALPCKTSETRFIFSYLPLVDIETGGGGGDNSGGGDVGGGGDNGGGDTGGGNVGGGGNSTGGGGDDSGGSSNFEGYTNADASPTGCLVVKGESARAGQPLILGDCSLNHNWRRDSAGLFHSELDDKLCMQVDAVSNDAIVSGVTLSVRPCDESNDFQKFTYSGGVIQLSGYESLCVGYRGDRSDVGQDPLLLKDCGKPGVSWTAG